MESEPKEEVHRSKADSRSESEENSTSSSHTCRVCGRSFPLLSSLSQHMRRHTVEKPYKCPYCEHRTAQKGSLKVHIRSHKLGLAGQSLDGESQEEKGEGEQQAQDSEEVDGGSAALTNGATPAKNHKVNGKTKKKGSKKKDGGKVNIVETEASPTPTEASVSGVASEVGIEAEAESEAAWAEAAGSETGAETEAAGPFPCGSCSQVFSHELLLKAHMKKHRGAVDHGCRICGRRFRQAWFLQSHMRIHRAKAQPKGGDASEPPATVNGVPQEAASLTNDECLYELCASCGNFFYDRKTLRLHERVHKQSHGQPQNPNHHHQPLPDPEGSAGSPAAKRRFLECLNLRAAGERTDDSPTDWSLGRRIPELDPVCSYQAWQLVTRGRVAEVTEKSLGWEERLADAEVAYNKEKGEYVALKVDKKRKQLDTCSNAKKKKGGASATQVPVSSVGRGTLLHQGGRILLNGIIPESLAALQKKMAKEGQQSSRQTNVSDVPHRDKKPYFCEHCDFHTTDAPSLRSHINKQHKDIVDLYNQCGAVLEEPSGPDKVSGYMSYLRLRGNLLSQPYWNPYTCPTTTTAQERTTASGSRLEKSQTVAEVKGRKRDATIDASLLNLSVPFEGQEDGCAANDETPSEGRLVRHRCPYCVHATYYPEVLWIHQRVAHKVDGTSTLAPKWAPHVNGFKGPKVGTKLWRRTGPPPFLEGKDCPALPVPQTQRTHPPGSALMTTTTMTGVKRTSSKTPKTPKLISNAEFKHTAQPTSSQLVEKPPPSSGRKTLLPQKKSVSRPSHTAEGAASQSRFAVNSRPEVTSSTSGLRGSAAPGFSHHQSTSSLKYGSHQVATEGSLLSQEGLGFILARNQGRTDQQHAPHLAPDRTRPPSQSLDTSAAPKGHSLWSVMNMFGAQGSGAGAYVPALFAQGKRESPGASPMDIDILSLLKNYNPHDLAALYQHWGYVDPRFDPQALMQLNGRVENEVHSSTETPNQVSSRSTTSLRKGT